MSTFFTTEVCPDLDLFLGVHKKRNRADLWPSAAGRGGVYCGIMLRKFIPSTKRRKPQTAPRRHMLMVPAEVLRGADLYERGANGVFAAEFARSVDGEPALYEVLQRKV